MAKLHVGDLIPKTSPVLELYDRLSKKAERGLSIQLTSREVDLLVVSGAYGALAAAATAELYTKAKQRLIEQGIDVSWLDALAQPAVMTAEPEPPSPEPPASEKQQILSVSQLANRWNVADSAVRALVHSRKLKHFRLGAKLIRFRLADIIEYEDTFGIVLKPSS